jgi:hypothetical protein
MKKKQLLAFLLTAALTISFGSAFATSAAETAAVKKAISVSDYKTIPQTAETILLNEQKAYTFNTTDNSEHYYQFVPTEDGIYDISVRPNTILSSQSRLGIYAVYDTINDNSAGGPGSLNDDESDSTGHTVIFKLSKGKVYYIGVLMSTLEEVNEGNQDNEDYYEECTGYITIKNHVHSYNLKDNLEDYKSLDASCTKDGYKFYRCKTCGIENKVTIPATGHSFALKKIEKAAQYENGYEWYYCDKCDASKSVTISRPQKITLSQSSYVYNNTVQKPTITVTDAKGSKIAASNYTVSYASGCKNVGKYKVTVKFKGNKYSGSLSTTYTIVPKTTALKSITAASKGFTVKWNKQATQTTGYQIQYSTSSKFTNAKTVTVSSNKTVSKKISKLSAKKQYYVRIRTYKTVNGTKYCSAWSAVKTVTTKK